MSNWEEEDDAYCTAAQDFQDARAVARELGIALHRVSFAAEYRERVFAHFLREHARRPHPESGRAVQPRDQVRRGAATGHGASARRTSPPATTRACCTAADGLALCKARRRRQGPELLPARACSAAQLARTLMPLGELHKSEVRARARRAGLPVFDKPDSTGICFIGERPFREFLAPLPRRAPPAPSNRPRASASAPTRGWRSTPSASAPGSASAGAPAAPSSRGTSPPRIAARNTLIVVQGHDHPLLAGAARSSPSAGTGCDARATRSLPLHREGALSPGRSAGAARAARRRRHAHRLRAAAARGHARSVRGRLRGRALSRRRRDRRAAAPRCRAAPPPEGVGSGDARRARYNCARQRRHA